MYVYVVPSLVLKTLHRTYMCIVSCAMRRFELGQTQLETEGTFVKTITGS